MDKCPKCKEYCLDFDPSKAVAICTNNGCGFRRKMTEDVYIVYYADRSKYVLIPPRIKRKFKTKRTKPSAAVNKA
jgi:hypothetical protein